MSSVYGLPRYVGTFLRHMEAYKDLLKWNITEGSHKITLTLTWNFQQQQQQQAQQQQGGGGSRTKGSSLWDKLQKTLRLSPTSAHASLTPTQRTAKKPTNLPEELTKFLDASTTRKRSPTGTFRRTLNLHSPFRRQLSWSRQSSLSMTSHTRSGITRSQSGPMTANHVSAGYRHSGRVDSCVVPDLRASGTSTFSPSPIPSASKSLPVSPSHFSWPGSPQHGRHQGAAAQSLPLTPNSVRGTPQSPLSSPEQSRVTLSFREGREIQRSLEDLMDRAQVENRQRLREIQQEWHHVVSHWDQLLLQETEGTGTLLNSSTDSDPSSTTIQDVSGTVQRCLHSCDRILGRHSSDV